MAPAVNNNRRHDIRTAIPLTKMTNPADFPQHVHRDYPLMLTEYKEIKVDGKKEPIRKVVPVLDEVDQPIIVASEDELETYLGNLEDEDKAEEIRGLLPRSSAERQMETDAALRELADSKVEIAKLKRLLAKSKGEPVEDDEDNTSEADNPAPSPGNRLAAVAARPKPGSSKNKVPATLKAAK